jgi:3-hydroxyacyl-[acyl-carrier-protein] dehydratase
MRFILIDHIETLEPGKRITGYKQIRHDEDYFADHFPGFPVVPGVLVLESLAQIGGRLVEATIKANTGRRVLPMLGKAEQAKFVRAVRPGDRLDLTCEVLAVGDGAARVTGVATVGGRRACTATIMYAIIDVNEAGGDLDPAQTAQLHAWSDRVWRELRGDRT